MRRYEIKSLCLCYYNFFDRLYRKSSGEYKPGCCRRLCGTSQNRYHDDCGNRHNRLSLSSSAQIFLSGNANAGNIFWQTAEGATLGTNSRFVGNILTLTDVAMQTDASMVGRFLAQTAVTFESNDVTVVPEPASYAALLGLGALSLVAIRRRIKKTV